MERVTRWLSRLTFAGILVLTTGQAAAAQQSDMAGFVGVWRCEHANYTIRNLAADNWSYSYVIQLNAEGTFYAEGQYFAQVVGYPQPFQVQGQWRIAPDGMIAQGQTTMGYTFVSGGTLSGNSYIWNGTGQAGRGALKCDRVQG